MDRRKFLQFLGIAAPAAVVASTLPNVARETLDAAESIRNWKSYKTHLTTTLKPLPKVSQRLYFDSSVFKEAAERRVLPINSGMSRQFFQYEAS